MKAARCSLHLLILLAFVAPVSAVVSQSGSGTAGLRKDAKAAKGKSSKTEASAVKTLKDPNHKGGPVMIFKTEMAFDLMKLSMLAGLKRGSGEISGGDLEIVTKNMVEVQSGTRVMVLKRFPVTGDADERNMAKVKVRILGGRYDSETVYVWAYTVK